MPNTSSGARPRSRMTPLSTLYRSADDRVPMSRGTGSIRSRFSAYARTLRTIWSVVWSMSCMGQGLRSPSRHHEDRDRRVPQDLGGSRAEEDLCDRSDVAGADHQHVTLIPGDVVERVGPILAVSDHGLD